MLVHVIITLLSSITHVISQFQCQGTCYSGSFPNNNQVIKGKHVRGYSYKNITTHVPHTCFSSCINDCRCKAFQMKHVRCELLDEDKTSKAADFVAERGYTYFPLHQQMYSKYLPPLQSSQCHNGCCQTQPCLNGGTCRETCNTPTEKFICTCTPAHHGRVCEKKVSSCGDVLKSAPIGPRPASGVYNITRRDNKQAMSIYCSFQEQQAWTLIESFSFENVLKYRQKAFRQDFPSNTDAPRNWTDYRLSLEMMKYVRSWATMFRATCDYPNRLEDDITTDSLVGYLSEYDIVGGVDITGGCTIKFSYINVRGQEFFNITTGLWHQVNVYHAHIDCHVAPCGNLNLRDAVAEDDCFGFYSPKRPGISKCTTTEQSTTQWWLGEHH